MKISNPKSRSHLSIKKDDHVLEVGPGNFPHLRSNVLVEKFIDHNYHRTGDVRSFKNQTLICADGEDLPFSDKSFDYSICCHVLEHVDNPKKFVAELVRVSHAGYLETPTLIGEYIMPKESHKWVVLEIDDKIVMYEKTKIDFQSGPDLSYLFQNYLPTQSIGYKIFQRSHYHLVNVNYEWKDNVELLVNPDSSYYKKFFTRPLCEDYVNKIFAKRSLAEEAKMVVWALSDIIKSVFKSKVLNN